jgi:hypothetical protein
LPPQGLAESPGKIGLPKTMKSTFIRMNPPADPRYPEANKVFATPAGRSSAGHTPGRTELSFDGFGINGPDQYRTRLATFPHHTSEAERQHYGALFAAAPDLLAALKQAASDLEGIKMSLRHSGDIEIAERAAQAEIAARSPLNRAAPGISQ